MAPASSSLVRRRRQAPVEAPSQTHQILPANLLSCAGDSAGGGIFVTCRSIRHEPGLSKPARLQQYQQTGAACQVRTIHRRRGVALMSNAGLLPSLINVNNWRGSITVGFACRHSIRATACRHLKPSTVQVWASTELTTSSFCVHGWFIPVFCSTEMHLVSFRFLLRPVFRASPAAAAACRVWSCSRALYSLFTSAPCQAHITPPLLHHRFPPA